MQNKINNEQAKFIEGQITNEVEITPIPAVAEDDNVRAGKFIFKGTDPETQAIGVNEQATEEDILGVAIRTPFQSYNGKYDNRIKKGKYFTYTKNGAVAVKTSTDAEIGSDVFVNRRTNEITTKQNMEVYLEQEKIYFNGNFKKVIYSTELGIHVAIGDNVVAWSEDGKTFNVIPDVSEENAEYIDIVISDTNTKFTILAKNIDSNISYILSSQDGKNFIKNSLKEQENKEFLAICYGNGLFVIVGNNAAAYSGGSMDFIESNIPDGVYRTVIYTDQRFIAMGDNNAAAYSSGGKDFTKSNLADDIKGNFKGMAYCDGCIMAIADPIDSEDQAFIAQSRDNGLNFSAAALIGSTQKKFNAITYSSDSTQYNPFVAVGDNIIYYMEYSGSEYNFSPVKTDYFYKDVTFANGVFIAVGDNVISKNIWMQDKDFVNYDFKGIYNSVVYDVKNELFTMVGDGMTAYGEYSNLNFVNGKIIYNAVNHNYNSILYLNNNKIYLVGDGVTAYYDDEDGIYKYNLTDKTYKSATYVSDNVFAAGTGTNLNGIIDYSPDGITYTSCQLPISSNGGFHSIIFNDNKIIAVGESKAVYSESSNYLNFASCSIPSYNWYDITVDNNFYVIVGFNINEDDGAGAWSEDGKTFTYNNLHSSSIELKKVVYGNDCFVTISVGGSLGVIRYSVNGKYFNASMFTDDKFNDIAFGNGVFVVVGNNYIQYSEHGDDFTYISVSGEMAPYKCIIYAGGYFVVVGDKGTVTYSQNGTEFKKIQIEEAKDINFSLITYDSFNNRYIVTAENDISTIYYLTFQDSCLNTGFKVLTSGKANETIKIYKN